MTLTPDGFKLIDSGLTLTCGRHVGSTGYFAAFRHSGEDLGGWADVGHGHTLTQAIDNAARIVTGRTYFAFNPSAFVE